MNSFTKLKNGAWGVKAEGTVKVGDKISVTKKDGESRTVTVSKVVWTGKSQWDENNRTISLCEIEDEKKKAAAPKKQAAAASAESAKRGRFTCPECGDSVEPGSECWETGLKH